jgi:hypothetical protein
LGNIAVIHFSPLELYPPVQNFIRLLEKDPAKNKITVFTTTGPFTELDLFEPNDAAINIVRLGRSGQHISSLTRMVGYLLFYVGCIFHLLFKRPRRILYYETISSFPALVYRRFFNRKVELLVHYHEYTSPQEYANGMKLTRLFHRFEKRIYPLAKWVSHTNNYRMELFEQDILPVKITSKKIVPNYPPASWFQPAKANTRVPVKVVYVGSLSMDTMYTKEFTEWVNNQHGAIRWDIYSYNITQETIEYFKQANSAFIVIKDGVNYEALPAILKQYDVGIVLYNGHIPNYVFNAPNKLFEYLSCGLDVWYPEIMTGTHSYNTENTYPRVLAFDFTRLNDFDYAGVICKEKLSFSRPQYFCEEAFSALLRTFTK